MRYTTVMRYKAMAKKLRQVVGLADPVPAEAVLAEPPRDAGKGKRDYGAYEIKGQRRQRPADGQMQSAPTKGTRGNLLESAIAHGKVPELAVEGTQGKVPELVGGGTRTKKPDVPKKMQIKVPELAVVRARAVWLEVVKGVRGSPSALMARLDALTDPERVEDVNMLAGWRAKYGRKITARMKYQWWRRLVRKRGIG